MKVVIAESCFNDYKNANVTKNNHQKLFTISNRKDPYMISKRRSKKSKHGKFLMERYNNSNGKLIYFNNPT